MSGPAGPPSFGDVGAAHEAVLGWCATHGHRPSGTRWEVYGPHSDDPAEQWTEVCWLLLEHEDA